ncbi:hypothetical protein [uncultured Maricaulis sp.]|uniref:hypothetical protein n=1 Tax=uncultured Maricaulis sp. TaxID=174710 RepID=UPI0030D71FF5|tara:strand:+ start:20100 stop:20438 length:339 start_codon:yes stop_codon:yes gene_type:complete
MTSPLRSAVLPVVTVCLVLGGCTAFEPLADQSTTPAWMRERLVDDVEGRKAPPAVPANNLTAADAAELDRDAAEVMRRRARQAAEIAAIEAEDRRAAEDFVAEGRTRTAPPQ